MILTLNHKASSCTKLHHFSLCRGVGCIFFEMATGRPFFPGSTVEDQLHLIFKVRKARLKPKWFASHANVTTRVCSDHILIGYLETEAIIDWLHKFDVRIFFFQTLGTPTEDTWPGITSNEIFLSGKYFHCSVFVRSSPMWLIFVFCCLCRKVSILSKGASYKSLAKVQSMHCRTFFLQ